MVCVTHDDVLQDLGKKGLKNLVVVPLSFVSEHVETLEEIDIEYREVANEVLSLTLTLSPPPPPVYTHVSQSFTRAMTDI
jgi:protoheme ferro-lyase